MLGHVREWTDEDGHLPIISSLYICMCLYGHICTCKCVCMHVCMCVFFVCMLCVCVCVKIISHTYNYICTTLILNTGLMPKGTRIFACLSDLAKYPTDCPFCKWFHFRKTDQTTTQPPYSFYPLLIFATILPPYNFYHAVPFWKNPQFEVRGGLYVIENKKNVFTQGS